MYFLRTVHKWASLLVGLQLLIWLVTGLLFNVIDHKKASGKQYLVHAEVTQQLAPELLVSTKELLAKYPSAQKLSLTYLFNKPYYLLTLEQSLYPNWAHNYRLIDAYTGKEQLVNEAFATDLARASYSGNGTVTAIEKVTPPVVDLLKQKNTLWQVNFNDEVNTSVFVNTQSGQVVGHSNDHKRFKDLLLFLHFMDYADEGSFNNAQIIFFGLVCLLLSITGFIWLIELINEGQYRPGWFTQRIKLRVLDKSASLIAEIKANKDDSLLDSLAANALELPSSCGGGGSCGQCRVKLTSDIEPTLADEHHFKEEQLAQGYRLACQHQCKCAPQVQLLKTIKG